MTYELDRIQQIKEEICALCFSCGIFISAWAFSPLGSPVWFCLFFWFAWKRQRRHKFSIICIRKCFFYTLIWTLSCIFYNLTMETRSVQSEHDFNESPSWRLSVIGKRRWHCFIVSMSNKHNAVFPMHTCMIFIFSRCRTLHILTDYNQGIILFNSRQHFFFVNVTFWVFIFNLQRKFSWHNPKLTRIYLRTSSQRADLTIVS